VSRLRAGGRSPLGAVAILPALVAGRAYRALARGALRGWTLRAVNRRRLARFLRAHPPAGHPLVYVIVMPGTLHFLLPCLRLVPWHVTVHLIANGARAWERRYLSAAFPTRPLCTLATLPASSLAHGDVVTLLIEGNEQPFGLLDHDCYVFDGACFDAAPPRRPECMIAWFHASSARTGLVYPETFFVVLEPACLRDIMRRHGIDAGIHRTVPRAARAALERLGLREGVPFKDHHDYFDTMHLIVALAMSEGRTVRFPVAPGGALVHLGGTSGGVAETKDLLDRYMHLRFLDLAQDLRGAVGYRRWFRGFATAADVRAAIPMTPGAFARLAAIDALVLRLQSL
jgi:hypothetical protein